MHRASSLPHLSFLRSPASRAVICLVSLAALGLVFGQAVQAQDLAAPRLVLEQAVDAASKRLVLKASPLLAEKPPEGQANKPPSFVRGDSVSGRPDLETVITGDAELRQGTSAIRADRIELYSPDNTLDARGNVRLSIKGNQYRGSLLNIKLDTYEGYFADVSYRFISNAGNGRADRIDFINEKTLIARNATYTTCERTEPASWGNPAWILTGTSFKFDQEAETGEATGAVLKFKGVPILAAPVFSFPTGNKRKSGLLPPTFNVDSTSGLIVSQPYYFDMAPNRDATFSSTLMSKRGIELGGEYRYLERDYRGRLRGTFMPGDQLRQRDRWSYALEHGGGLDTGLAAIGSVGLSLNLNRVSDDDFWRDSPRIGVAVPQRLLTNDAVVSWGQGYFTSSIRALKWQTLQDPLSRIVPPYDRLPQVAAAYTRVNVPLAGVKGFDWSLLGDFTRFSANRLLTEQPNSGDRAVGIAQISHPWIAPSGFITPKLQLHATTYRFDSALNNGNLSASRIVPTFSLDSGLQYERKANFFGRDFTQTLEPRAFYVRTPYRDQSLLPNYDSGLYDFNFATIFTPNAFVGNDRISDSDLLTLGMTSRLLNPDSGAEAVRVGVAQRLRFSDQKVFLPVSPTAVAGVAPVLGTLPVADRISDVLFGTSINWDPRWAFDGTVQYNPKLKVSERSTFGVRYNPGPYRVISASLRRQQRNISNSVDVGWQWPINDLWGDKGKDLGAGRGQGGGRYYSVGRLNYSVPDKKLVDGIVGLEYDGCCWISRVVLQRTQIGVAVATTRILFELELIGFSRLGVSPLEVLKQNIPRYQLLRDPVTAPSRFTNYD